MPNGPDFNFTRDQDFTVSFWVLAEGQQQDATCRCVHRLQWSNARRLSVRGALPPCDGLHIAAARYDGTHNPGVESATAINDSQFHHVVFVKNSDAGALHRR
ncbi:MAG: hypothetical protein H6644_02795 [Caldilineaceae bacterium]|nr:hypothetical protein [Caldilineaceae bacterium]